MNVLNLEHISKTYGEKVIFDDISCGIHQGDKIGIIGINGTGKTTFLRILAGFEEMKDRWLCRMAFVSHICRSILNFQRAQPFFLT